MSESEWLNLSLGWSKADVMQGKGSTGERSRPRPASVADDSSFPVRPAVAVEVPPHVRHIRWRRCFGLSLGGGVSVNPLVSGRPGAFAGPEPTSWGSPATPLVGFKGEGVAGRAEARAEGAGMRRCPCRGSLSEAEAGALPAGARMGLEALRGGRRRQPGLQRPGPGAGGPTGRPVGGGPQAWTEGSSLHSEAERTDFRPVRCPDSPQAECCEDGHAVCEAAGLGAESEKPIQHKELDGSSLQTHPERNSPWAEMEMAGSWTDGFRTDPHRSDLQSQPKRGSLCTQPGFDESWTGLERLERWQTLPERDKPWVDHLRTHHSTSKLQTHPDGVCPSPEPRSDGHCKEPSSDGSSTPHDPDGSWTESQTHDSLIRQSTQTAWKQPGRDDFSTQETDGAWIQSGIDGPWADSVLGESNGSDPLEEPEPGELVANLCSHLECSSLCPVPRLIITPETPEPEAQPVGPPSRIEGGTGGFSSASSFDESEDDLVAGGGGTSDPEDRSGVSRTHSSQSLRSTPKLLSSHPFCLGLESVLPGYS